MRKIESQMCSAIQNNADWKNANTEVESHPDGFSRVYLHDNLIAEVGDDYIQLFDGGYQTKTTKSRMNAILNKFGYTQGSISEYVYQHQFDWFVQVYDEKSEQLLVKQFESGMIIK